MLYGIKYDCNKNGLKMVTKSLDNYGSAIMVKGELDFAFKNLFDAMVVCRRFNKSHRNLNYKIYVLSKEEKVVVKKDRIVGSLKEYEEIRQKDKKELDEKLEELLKQQRAKTEKQEKEIER